MFSMFFYIAFGGLAAAATVALRMREANKPDKSEPAPTEDPLPSEDPVPTEDTVPDEDPAPDEDPVLPEDPAPAEDPAPSEDPVPEEPVDPVAEEPTDPVAEDTPEDPPADPVVPDPVVPDPEPEEDITPPTTGDETGEGEAPVLDDAAYDIGWMGLSAEEQYMVELINRARLDPVAEQGISGDVLAKASNATPDEALAVLEPLADSARAHSADMDDRQFFSHTNPDGDSPTVRAQEEGYFDSWVGENIGWIGSSWTSFDQQARVTSHHENLWESDGHQNNLLGDNYNVMGVGYDYGDYQGYEGGTMVTEVFSNDGNTYLTGVVIEDGDGDAFYDMGEGQGGVRITAWDDADNVYGTSTWDAGGYTLELPPGTYTVRFEGGDLDQPYETQVTVTDENVKLDVLDPGASETVTTSALIMPDPDGVADPFLPLIPVSEDDIPVEDDELLLDPVLF